MNNLRPFRLNGLRIRDVNSNASLKNDILYFFRTNRLDNKNQAQWMERLLRRSYRIGTQGEIPVSAIILNKLGQCIGWGTNCRERDQDPMGHAELIALRQAAFINRSWRLNDCTLLVTLEPCPMCSGALLQARISSIIYGASDYKRGGLGGSIDLSKDASAHHSIAMIKNLKVVQSSELLESWFRQRRKLYL